VADGLLPAVPPPELMSPAMHREVLMEQQDGQPVSRRLTGIDHTSAPAPPARAGSNQRVQGGELDPDELTGRVFEPAGPQLARKLLPIHAADARSAAGSDGPALLPIQ